VDRKQAILQAAIDLFAEHGFNSTSTAAVAKKAGVAEGLIFHYFKTKKKIITHILHRMIDDYMQEIVPLTRKASNGLGAIETIIRHHFRFSQHRQKEFVVLVRDLPSELMHATNADGQALSERQGAYLTLMENCIERGMNDGSIKATQAPETAFIIHGMLDGMCRLTVKLGSRAPQTEQLEAQVIDFCRRSLAAEKQESRGKP